MNARRPLTVVALLALAAGLAGCGYHVGPLTHPQLRRLAVAPVRNETNDGRLAALAAEKLRNRLVQEGSVQLVSTPQADAVLETTVKTARIYSRGTVEVNAGDDRQQAYRTTLYGVEVEVEYTLIRQGRAVLAPRTIMGTGEFSELPDLDTMRLQGYRQALTAAADRVISDVTEAW